MSVRKIGFLTATALVVANMIGTGVFTSLGFQVGPIPSVPVLIFLWFCGGMVALCGGLSYIQLTKLYPDFGGEFHYIRQAYHPIAAYAAGIISVVAGFAAPVALAVMTFCAYFSQIIPDAPPTTTACILISCITLIHCFSLKLSGRFQLISTVLKVLLILSFILYGLLATPPGNISAFKSTDLQLITSSGFGSSLIYVSFAYSGWNACVYIFHEIKDPQRNIKRSIIAGTLLVTALYMLLNYVFLKAVPLKQLEQVVEVGAVAADALFGKSGGRIIAALISFLLISSISAMVWTGSRVISKMTSVMSVRRPKPHEKEIPLIPIIIQYLITLVLIVSNSFEQILMYTSILLILSSCMAVVILFKEHKSVRKIHLVPAGVYLIANAYAIFVLIWD